MLYNLVLFVSIKETSYLYYSVYAGSIILIYFALDGFGFKYIWPNQIWWQQIATLTGLAASVAIIALLTLNFLQINKLSRLWHRALWGLVWVTADCLLGLLIKVESGKLRLPRFNRG